MSQTIQPQQIQKEYNRLLKEVSGKDWKKDRQWSTGHAGACITISFLHNGSLRLKTLTENIPDFSQTEIRMALKKLKENGYLEKNKKGQYQFCIGDEDITSIVFWGLLINVVNGFIKRSNKPNKK